MDDGCSWCIVILNPAISLISNSGVVKIADFEIAHAVGFTDDIEGIRGTPAYMSPEQSRNEQMTAQSDIFSLGLCLFEAFTGKKDALSKDPSRNGKLIRNAEKVLLEPENVAALRVIHPQLLDVLRPCLYADPKRRYTSVVIYRDGLHRWLHCLASESWVYCTEGEVVKKK